MKNVESLTAACKRKQLIGVAQRNLGAAFFILCTSCFITFTACSPKDQKQEDNTVTVREENREAKAMLQGVWHDAVTEEPYLKAVGDTIFFADGTSQPAFFRIVDDSIELGTNTYHIVRQTEHNFCFENGVGDEVQLVKPDEVATVQPEFISEEPKVISATEVVNVDSVVMHNGQRYHWYVTVNPTRYRVTRTTFTPDGVAVEKVFYDNIIHVSVFKSGQRLFTRDFNKHAYAADVPEDFLSQSILGNIRFSHTDAQGLHFYATICIPDGEQCYMVENLIGFDGKLTQRLLEN